MPESAEPNTNTEYDAESTDVPRQWFDGIVAIEKIHSGEVPAEHDQKDTAKPEMPPLIATDEMIRAMAIQLNWMVQVLAVMGPQVNELNNTVNGLVQAASQVRLPGISGMMAQMMKGSNNG